jgi:hypothetical protein
MPFRYSCFISYRHARYKQARTYTQQIVEALQGELEMRTSQEVFRDIERLRGGEFYNETLATALCQSMCMLMLYWPTYFSPDHTFCSREYKAMEKLEGERRKLLNDPREQGKGLIITIALLDFHSIPQEIRGSRQCYDFEPYTLRGDMRRIPEFKSKIREIGDYIAERCKAYSAIPEPPDICEGCHTFSLPTEADVLPWLSEVVHPGVPFPNR